MPTETRVNVSELEKGDRLVRAAHRAPGSCLFVCSHEACVEPETVYTVLGKRRAPKGERVRLRHPDGWGCALVADAKGDLPIGWSRVEGYSELPLGLDCLEALVESFCACGRVVSRCDGSRVGCARRG